MTRLRLLYIIYAVLFLPLLCGCLGVFSERYSNASIFIHNNTDKTISMVAHKSMRQIDSTYSVLDTSVYKSRINDTIFVLSAHNNFMEDMNFRGGGCVEFDFELFMDRLFDSDRYVESTFIDYTIDSIELVFDSNRRLCIHKDFSEFWQTNKCYQKDCNKHKGECSCTFNCYITDEMYEQATPICR